MTTSVDNQTAILFKSLTIPPFAHDIDDLCRQVVASTKIAAVVVLYFPDENVRENILSYLDQVDLVILVDNSDEPAYDLLEKFSNSPKVHSIVNGCNLGIATALNIGAKVAIARGCSYLLTMDQDSRATPEMVVSLRSFFVQQDIQPLAIVSPFHLTAVSAVPNGSSREFENVDTVWTSGNLLSLSAYQDVGPFKESLFIDFVDHEYCLRLRKSGYNIIQLNKIILYHNIGNDIRKVIDTKKIQIVVSNHTPLRRYYITRNRFYVIKKYPEFKKFCSSNLRRFFVELIIILFYEDKKITKYYMVARGYIDYRLGLFGEYCGNQVERGSD